jgi:hypothetical protein
MGNRHLNKIESLHMLGAPEFERLKVTALPSPKRLRAGRSKSFPPHHLSPLLKYFFHITTQSRWGEGWGEGTTYYFLSVHNIAYNVKRFQGEP